MKLDKALPDNNKDISLTIKIKCTDKDKVDPKSTTIELILLRQNKNNPVRVTKRSIPAIPESLAKGEIVGFFQVVDDEGDVMKFNDLSNLNTKSKFNLTDANCSLVLNGTQMKCDVHIGINSYLHSRHIFVTPLDEILINILVRALSPLDDTFICDKTLKVPTIQ